jgi:hypothetical protein
MPDIFGSAGLKMLGPINQKINQMISHWVIHGVMMEIGLDILMEHWRGTER